MYKNCEKVVSKANECLDILRTLLFDPDAPYDEITAPDSDGDDDGMEEEGRATSARPRNRALYSSYDAHAHLKIADALAVEIADIPATFEYEPLVEWVRKVLRFMGCLPEKLFRRVQLEGDESVESRNKEFGVLSYSLCCELLANPDAAAVSNVTDSLYALMETIGIFEPPVGNDAVVDYNPSLNPIVRHAESAYEFLKREEHECKSFITKGEKLLREDYSRLSVGDIANAIDELQDMTTAWDKMVVTPSESLLSELQSMLLHLECSLKDRGSVKPSSSPTAAASGESRRPAGKGSKKNTAAAVRSSNSGGEIASSVVRDGKNVGKGGGRKGGGSSNRTSTSSAVATVVESSGEEEAGYVGMDDQAFELWMDDTDEAPDDDEADG